MPPPSNDDARPQCEDVLIVADDECAGCYKILRVEDGTFIQSYSHCAAVDIACGLAGIHAVDAWSHENGRWTVLARYRP